eukprot:gnl/Spiro4/4162_TR2080_c0_g1_i1.p1 gnl/Spiro4/4162_TR2080_c0_g1~~gnl/Spiro4/4162_TR2080_c0_g1_i1.p1  ORF type:complete len:311 (+),score=59.27 gnl/Spiro4/4162_TR2080_c0_g1_i1:30-935(+)
MLEDFSHVISPKSDSFQLPISHTTPHPTEEELPPVQVQTIIEGKAWVLSNVFSPYECSLLVEETLRLGYDPLDVRNDYRSNDRLVIHSTAFADILYRRTLPYIPPVVQIAENDTSLNVPSFGLDGTWDANSLNPVVRFCRYTPGQLFCPHRDGFFYPDSERRSFYTIMLYLNDVAPGAGGETNFLDDSKMPPLSAVGPSPAPPEAIISSIRPRCGQILLFWHPLLHEGGRVLSGEKYMVRSEVMFHRRPGSFSPIDDATRQAMALVTEADNAEANGECMRAVELLRRAYKLSPALARAHGS